MQTALVIVSVLVAVWALCRCSILQDDRDAWRDRYYELAHQVARRGDRA